MKVSRKPTMTFNAAVVFLSTFKSWQAPLLISTIRIKSKVTPSMGNLFRLFPVRLPDRKWIEPVYWMSVRNHPGTCTACFEGFFGCCSGFFVSWTTTAACIVYTGFVLFQGLNNIGIDSMFDIYKFLFRQPTLESCENQRKGVTLKIVILLEAVLFLPICYSFNDLLFFLKVWNYRFTKIIWTFCDWKRYFIHFSIFFLTSFFSIFLLMTMTVGTSLNSFSVFCFEI